MTITKPFQIYLQEKLTNYFGRPFEIIAFQKLHGGSVNYSYLIKGKEQSLFIKLNSVSSFPKMFELEQRGLELIASTRTIGVPNVLLQGEFESYSFLILEFIENGRKTNSFWEQFGKQIAALHQNKSIAFGLPYDNFIGSIKQSNKQTDNWVDFFASQRLEAQLKIAFDQGLVDDSLKDEVEKLIKRLPKLIPNCTASLLHGDLWSGNFMANKASSPTVFDPAVYFGNREMDIAMSMLFGGFNKRFYDSYNSVYPLSKGWDQRIDLCNAYPLLVHVNLFGASYARRLKSTIKKYL